MKCVIPEIAYHNRDPVLSVDFQPPQAGQHVRLATAGSDTHVVVWAVKRDQEDKVELDCLCDLTRHQRAVNIVRWSPDGQLLASGDDESVIIVWKMKEGQGEAGNLFDEGAEENQENWVVYKMLRFHLDDVYDLSWSPCSTYLLSGSVDNTAIISNVHKNKKMSHLSDSRGFVQGVAWNKKHNLVSTVGSDRSCRTYNSASYKMINKTYKCSLDMNMNKKSVSKKKKKVVEVDGKEPVKEPAEVQPKPSEESAEVKDPVDKSYRLFHDDTFKGFFRRLAWSNDGELLVVPSGVIETDGDNTVTHCTWVFSRVDMTRPALCLPTKDKYTIAVRFCPLLFTLRPVKTSAGAPKSEEPEWVKAKSVFALPYRMIYAVATANAVMFYDTQQAAPFGRVSNIHYTGLTDLSWSPCGTVLVVSSSDGFCSIVTFSAGELGELLPGQQEVATKVCSSPGAPLSSSPILHSPSSPALASLSPGPVLKPGPKRLQFVTLSSPKAERKGKAENKGPPASSLVFDGAMGGGDGDDGEGVERMETEELSLVLEESQLEPPATAVLEVAASRPVETKKRVPLTTLANTVPPKPRPSTPDKKIGRRVSLITLSSPKGKP